MIQLMHISANQSTPTTYMTVSAVLAFLAFLTIWREASSGGHGYFFSRTFAAFAFMGSRIVAVIFSGSLISANVAPPVLYMTLNFLCLYLAARSYPNGSGNNGVLETPNGNGVEKSGAVSRENDRREEWRKFKIQTGILATVAAVLYLILPKPTELGTSFGGFAAVVLFAATVRVLMYLVRSARRAANDTGFMLQALILFLVVSWLSVVFASLTSGSASSAFLHTSRIADILSLVSALIVIQTSFLTLGFYHKNRADSKEEEAEKAKAELNLLSRVASDIYEDSNTMIQRQQDQSRSLLRRVGSLEKILEIAITIQERKNLKDLLQMIAELIKGNLGFNTVIIRLLNDRTQSFETKAQVGLSEEAKDAVLNYRLPVAEYHEIIDPRSKISRSYFVKNATSRDEDETESSADAVLLKNQWADIDRLIIPMVDENEDPIGYISVEDPDHTTVSVVEAIDNLETVATLAVLAIHNANFFREIGEKNQKLNTYAEKLASLNKMKSNFVATISHEFRTPLTSIKAYCETLLKNVDNVDRRILKEFLVVIDEESDRLMSLIEGILDFSQMESGAAKMERTVCNVNEVITVASKELEKNFDRKNITLHEVLPDNEVVIRAERELMKQLFINLLHNASKFTQENGDVWIKVEEETVSIRITVEDNGIGIPKDQLEVIFDRFQQGDGSSTREYGGSGLGLAICKNIVDWHDGKIWVENNSGRGTRFVVVVPRKHAVVRGETLIPYDTVRRYEIERYLELLVEMIAELMNVNKASIMALDKAENELRIDSAIGIDEEIVEHARVKLGEGIAGKVALENRSHLVENIDEDTQVSAKNNDYIYDSRSFLSVPIPMNGEVIGVINVANPANKETFDQNDRQLLEFFAIRVGLAYEKLRDFMMVSLDFEDVRGTFRSMLDSRRYFNDSATEALDRVLVEVAQHLGLTQEENATLQYTFSMYDLGLAKGGCDIVKRTQSLTQEDRKSVEQHTIVGTEMIKPIEAASDVKNAVLYHHENYDGTGYPGKLAGEEIPIYARIIRVADSFRALISHRPYQRKYNIKEALDVLTHRSGAFFDPKIVNVFNEIVRKNIDEFKVESTTGSDKQENAVEASNCRDDATDSQGGY